MGFERGKPIAASKLNKSAAKAAQGANVTGAGVNVVQAPGGNTITLPPLVIPDNNLILCEMTGSDAVIYGAVEIFDGANTGGAPSKTLCRLPSQSGFSRIGSIQKGVASGTDAKVQFQGIGWVLFDFDSVPVTYQTRVGWRLGAFKDSHIARYDQLGPMLVKKDLGIISGIGRIALVEFTGRRGDNKIADDPNDIYDGPYETYVWSPVDFTVSEDSTGVIAVDLV